MTFSFHQNTHTPSYHVGNTRIRDSSSPASSSRSQSSSLSLSLIYSPLPFDDRHRPKFSMPKAKYRKSRLTRTSIHLVHRPIPISTSTSRRFHRLQLPRTYIFSSSLVIGARCFCSLQSNCSCGIERVVIASKDLDWCNHLHGCRCSDHRTIGLLRSVR